MKPKIVAAICVVAIASLLALGVASWHTQQVQDRVARAKAYASQQYHEQLEKAAVKAEQQHLHDDCVKQQQFYNGQSVAYQKVTARPQCDLQMVE